MNRKNIALTQNKIYDWYKSNKRSLPWRNTKNPYEIWISEIILQQTRVAQGLDYYNQFLLYFPTVETLAKADESEVLKKWQGLGYYTRARNLHKAAQLIVNEHNSLFPNSYDAIISLPGIGQYTAAAISSFAFDLPHAVLDGNVFRVLARLYDDETPIDTHQGKKHFQKLADQFLNSKDPALHNQSIMEFGALQCSVKTPSCDICPLNNYCKAYKNNTVALLPIKQGKQKVRNRYFNYLFIKNHSFTYLNKRTKKDIWKNLYELILFETDEEKSLQELMMMPLFQQTFDSIEVEVDASFHQIKHILSHQTIFAKFYTIQVNEENKALKAFEKTPLNEIDKYPISRLTELFFEKELSTLDY